jgi:hypothetical protein
VPRSPPSPPSPAKDATLNAIFLSSVGRQANIPLSPQFNRHVFRYTATVDHSDCVVRIQFVTFFFDAAAAAAMLNATCTVRLLPSGALQLRLGFDCMAVGSSALAPLHDGINRPNRGGVWVRLQGLLCQLQVCSTSPPSPSAGGRHLLGSGGWSGPTYVGPNIIQVEVTAADGTVSNIYEVQVRPLILFWGETVGNVCEG